MFPIIFCILNLLPTTIFKPPLSTCLGCCHMTTIRTSCLQTLLQGFHHLLFLSRQRGDLIDWITKHQNSAEIPGTMKSCVIFSFSNQKNTTTTVSVEQFGWEVPSLEGNTSAFFHNPSHETWYFLFKLGFQLSLFSTRFRDWKTAKISRWIPFLPASNKKLTSSCEIRLEPCYVASERVKIKSFLWISGCDGSQGMTCYDHYYTNTTGDALFLQKTSG